MSCKGRRSLLDAAFLEANVSRYSLAGRLRLYDLSICYAARMRGVEHVPDERILFTSTARP